MVLFWALGWLQPRMKPRLVVALVLGGMQGLLGWYMVMSGLIDEPRVSHFRLAAHLLLAMALLAYIFWLLLDVLRVRPRVNLPAGLAAVVWATLALVVLQIFYGALTAGSRAGYGYNTFPLMNGQFMADAVFYMSPWWHNLTESTATVQFIHRWLGALVVLATAYLWLRFRGIDRGLTWGSTILLAVTLIQFLLGVLTLVNVVQLELASIHQGGACVLLLVLTYVLYLSQSRAA
jgi:cytochrome c oxidase assembly protein subunit 15